MHPLIEDAKNIYNRRVSDFIDQGGRAVGYSCVALPVEILLAAKVLPYRIRALGNSKMDLADARLSRFNCSYCRSCLQLGLKGDYDFLEGLVEVNGCDHIRGMFENWHYEKKQNFFHYVKVPHQVNEDAIEYFTEEIKLFKDAVQKHFAVEISDDAILDEMEKADKAAEAMERLYETRKADSPLFTGAQALSVFLTGAMMMPEDFAKELNGLIDNAKPVDRINYKARLMVCGSATDEIELISEIEKVGGLIVADEFCFGARAFWNRRRDENADPFRQLATIYLENLLCPRMVDDFKRRFEVFYDQYESSKADGVIVMHNKFCDVHGIDNVQLKMAFEKRGVPVLSLEKEYGAAADIGRVKTRVQAFLERIGDR